MACLSSTKDFSQPGPDVAMLFPPFGYPPASPYPTLSAHTEAIFQGDYQK